MPEPSTRRPGYVLLDDPNPHGPHFYPSRRSEVRIGVVHTAENLPDFDGVDDGAEAVANYGANTDRQVSWHVTIDSDSIIPMLPDDHTAWHVRGFNSPSVGKELATRAAMWDDAPDDWLEAIILNAAAEAARWKGELGIPVQRITKSQAQDGKKGIVPHSALDPSRRSDPGGSFPWDMYLDFAVTLARGGQVGGGSSGSGGSGDDGGSSGFSAGGGGSSAPAPSSPSTGGGSESLAEALPVISNPSTGFHAARAQSLVHAHEVPIRNTISPDGRPDKLFYDNTEEAVREFQRRAGITVDGIVGPVTWTNLIASDFAGDELVGKGHVEEGLLVRIAQSLCAAAGFPPANSHDPTGWDGIVGFHTDRAVKKFQKRRGILVDGIVGPTTLSHLFGQG